MYDLVANVVHDGDPKKGTYRVHVLQKVRILILHNFIVSFALACLQGTGKWYEMQDLHVTEVLPQMITLTEAYIQVKYLVI